MNGIPYIRRHFDFGNLAEFLEPYFNTIPKNNTYLETGDAMSSVNIVMPHTMPELDGLMDLVYQACEMFYENLTKEKCKDYITRSWMNKHLRTGKTTEHSHEGVELVMSCYVSVPENSGNFELYYEGKWYTVPVKTNDVLIFPGSVVHRTETSQSDLPRIEVTLNITEKFYSDIDKMKEIFDHDPSDQEALQKHFINMMGKISDKAAHIETKLLEME